MRGVGVYFGGNRAVDRSIANKVVGGVV